MRRITCLNAKIVNTFRRTRTNGIVRLVIAIMLIGFTEIALAGLSMKLEAFMQGCTKAKTTHTISECIKSFPMWVRPNKTKHEYFVQGCRAQLIVEDRNNNIEEFVAYCFELDKRENK